MKTISRLPFLVRIFFFLIFGFAACTPIRHFDYTTNRVSKREQAAPSFSEIAANQNPSAIEEEAVTASSILPGNHPAESLVAAKALVAARPSVEPSMAPSISPAQSRQDQAKMLKKVRQEVKTQRKELKKALRQAKAQGPDHPLNDGVTAALLLLALGVVLLLLATILPAILSVIGWILGIAVVLIGITFLVLTLLGFDVQIIG